MKGVSVTVYDDDDKQIGEFSYYLSNDQRYLKYKQLETLKSNNNFPLIPTILVTNIISVQFSFCEEEESQQNRLPIGFVIKFKDENDQGITHRLRMVSMESRIAKSWFISFQKALRLLYETRDSSKEI